jgi:hypothetical protein
MFVEKEAGNTPKLLGRLSKAGHSNRVMEEFGSLRMSLRRSRDKARDAMRIEIGQGSRIPRLENDLQGIFVLTIIRDLANE